MNEMVNDQPIQQSQILSWLPFTPKDHILIVAKDPLLWSKAILNGQGEITTCSVEQVKDKLQRTKETPIREYDYVLLIECFSKDVFTLLTQVLSQSGKLMILVTNQLGLTYFAGTKEEGSQSFFGGLENAENKSGVRRSQLIFACEQAGLATPYFYYPYPGITTCLSLYSQDYLPKKGELIDTSGIRNTDRIVLFDEAKVFDQLIEENCFEQFANSYFLVTGKEEQSGVKANPTEWIRYVKFSTNRAKEYQIITMMTEDDLGQWHLIKQENRVEAKKHIAHIEESYHALERQYAHSVFSINSCKSREKGVELDFLVGYTLEEELDSLIAAGEKKKARERLLAIVREMKNCPLSEYVVTPEFEQVFPGIHLPQGLYCSQVSDVDMIMGNIFVSEQKCGKKHTIIDYEWTFHFPIPIHFICYRALHYYVQTTASRRILDDRSLFEEAGMTLEEIRLYEQMEVLFQEYIQSTKKESENHQLPSYHISSLLHNANESNRRRALQIYADCGEGFCEEQSVTYLSKSVDGKLEIAYKVPNGCVALRVDPGSDAGTVLFHRFNWKNEAAERMDIVSTGHKLWEGSYLFETDDPYLIITPIPPQKDLILEVHLQIDPINQQVAKYLVPKVDLKYRIKKLLKKV